MAEEKTFSVGVQTSSPKRISVTSNVSENPITASADTGLYYSQLAKNWAIGEGLIQNEDYSSKTWAGESKSSADLSKMYSEAASLDLNNLENRIIEYDEQLNTTITEGLENINTSVTSGVETIETTKTEASEYVETTANESIAEVNQAKEQAIKDFNKASDKVNYLFVMPIGTIGFSPFPIDETKGLRRILNGQIIIQEQFTGFVKWLKENIELYPQMACTEEEWQAAVTMSINGTCDKFVIDDEAGTIRLPKYPQYANKEYEFGTASVTVNNLKIYGNGKVLGLTNGSLSGFAVGVDSYLSPKSSSLPANIGTELSSSASPFGGRLGVGVIADANKSGLTGNGTGVANLSSAITETTQKGYWFIQVATGAEETVDVTREIELNNPFFFGYYQYFETAPNNISWLKSAGQWNSKAIYTDYYDWILTNANNGVENFKLSTDTYDDYAWVVNTADETFRLPIKTKNAPFTVNGTANVSVYGNGKVLGLTNGNATAYLGVNGQYGQRAYMASNALNNLSVTTTEPTETAVNGKFGVTTDPTKSGLIGKATVSTSENTNVSLYFYVGETVQNANLINAGRIEEVVVGKVNRTGDTMTGALTLQNTLNIKQSNTLDYTDTNHTTVSETAGVIYFRDKNAEVAGFVQTYFNQYNNMVLATSARRSIDGTVKTAQTQLYVDKNGNANFNFPMCTTKATTTSSARNDLVAVVVQNYVSGTSWYRVWSDGWIEQGGASAFTSSASTGTVTFAKKFTATPTINISGTFNAIAEIEVDALTASNFTWVLNTGRTGTIYYYACGY